MKNKIIALLVVVASAVLLLFGLNYFSAKPVVQKGDKAITIVVVNAEDGNKELFKGVVYTNANYLGGAIFDEPKLQPAIEDGQYGRFITGLCGVSQGDMKTGPWWLYSSEKNEVCKAQGMCPGIDDVVIKDGDDFTFTLTSKF